jgi:hypothetical protein
MRNRVRIALAALAIGCMALPRASAAQAGEAAQVAETAGPSAAAGPSWDSVVQAVAKMEASAPSQPESESAQPTWDAVIRVIGADLPEPAGAGRTAVSAAAEALAEAGVQADGGDPSTSAAVQLADWIIATGDNDGLPFIVIDKAAAALLIFDAEGEFLGLSPVLLGVASGDDATPGIGERPLSEIGPAERTTPAGRYMARYGFAYGGVRVLWVDYATSVALHPVVTGNRRERRLQRLRSPTPEDNRITFGCINVPVPFYRNVVRPQFRDDGGIVYILPEVRPIEDVFPRLRLGSAPRATAL